MAKRPIEVEALKHPDATRRNIPTAEFESVMRAEDKTPVQLAYERRNRDLDPQLVWRGKDEQDWSDLIVQAPPLYIQEKLHPKVLIDDLKRQTKERASEAPGSAPDLFADFNGLPDKEAATEFYQHDQHWSNRMILGDSLSVMGSLAEREGLRGQVQCIYFDPPYGIRFNSNFQWSTTSRDVKDGAKDQITREPEQVRAFRDTWRDAPFPPGRVRGSRFRRPGVFRRAGYFPLLPCLPQSFVQSCAEGFKRFLRALPKLVNLSIVGDGFKSDVRHPVVDEAKSHISPSWCRPRRRAGDLCFLALPLWAVRQ